MRKASGQGPRLHRVARKIAGVGERSPVLVWRSLLSTPTRLPLHAGGAAAPTATAAAAAAVARAAAAAALAGRGHVTQPAGSLGAGKRARGGSAARTGTRSRAPWRGRLRGGPGERVPSWRARARRLELAARSGKGVRSEGRGTRASTRPSLSSFPESLGSPLPPPPPARSFPPAAACDWLRSSDVRVSMTYQGGGGAAGEEGVARARGAVTAAVWARGREAAASVEAGQR